MYLKRYFAVPPADVSIGAAGVGRCAAAGLTEVSPDQWCSLCWGAALGVDRREGNRETVCLVTRRCSSLGFFSLFILKHDILESGAQRFIRQKPNLQQRQQLGRSFCFFTRCLQSISSVQVSSSNRWDDVMLRQRNRRDTRCLFSWTTLGFISSLAGLLLLFLFLFLLEWRKTWRVCNTPLKVCTALLDHNTYSF